jgi:hypothetical protein
VGSFQSEPLRNDGLGRFIRGDFIHPGKLIMTTPFGFSAQP